MTHDEAKHEVAELFEGSTSVKREALLAHLKGCDPCRAHYDATALAMRRMLGNPEEMTPEELYLFEPPLPAAQVVPLFRTGPAVALAMAAMLAAVVVWFASAPKDDFGVRDGPKAGAAPGFRAVCMKGDLVQTACHEGDVVVFAVTANGAKRVDVTLDGAVVGSQDLSDTPDQPLSFTVPFKAGMKVKAEFSGCAACTQTVVTISP
jgi:hypothetical protein